MRSPATWLKRGSIQRGSPQEITGSAYLSLAIAVDANWLKSSAGGGIAVIAVLLGQPSIATFISRFDAVGAAKLQYVSAAFVGPAAQRTAQNTALFILACSMLCPFGASILHEHCGPPAHFGGGYVSGRTQGFMM